MPVEIQHKIVVSNGHIDDWTPESRMMDGVEMVKLVWKDRKFFRFCTGTCIKQGVKAGQQKHKFAFWEYLVACRKNASQMAFDTSERANMRENGREPPAKKRWRVCKDSDAAIVGEKVEVQLVYGEKSIVVQAGFGISTTEIWVEATVNCLTFIQNAIYEDFEAQRFAATFGRGEYFRRSGHRSEHENEGDEEEEHALDSSEPLDEDPSIQCP